MNNKGTNIFSRIEITLLLLKFVWVKKNVAMIDIMLSEEKEWAHNIIGSNLLTSNIKRVKEIVKSFMEALQDIFWKEIGN